MWSHLDDEVVNQHRPMLGLDEAVKSLGITDRDWFVLERRLGPGEVATLEDVAAELELTRERIRQIQKKVAERIYRRLGRLSPFLKAFEQGIDRRWLTRAAQSKSIAHLTKELEAISETQNWEKPGPSLVERLIVVLRAVVDEYPTVAVTLPTLTFAACILEPEIGSHKAVAESVKQWDKQARDESRNWTYSELAEAVLLGAGEPLHWTAMADRAESLGRRQQFSRTGFFNAVQRTDTKFARVDAGTYGLTDWGLSDVANYTDLVAVALDKHGKALTEGTILQEVSSRRSTNPNSLKMTLDFNVRFYKSLEGTYGLRCWLPERHRQTLRTPPWLVEAAESLRRVSRAEQRGYKVSEIVERDRGLFRNPQS